MRKIKIGNDVYYIDMLKIEFSEKIPGEIIGVQIKFDKPIEGHNVIRIFPNSDTFQKVFSSVKWGKLLNDFLEVHFSKKKGKKNE